MIAIETLRLFNEVQERTAETERTRKVMQTAFDNMGDGVALLDKDLRLQFMSQERIKSRQFPPELVQPGVPARDLMLFQARRGDYGPVANEADVERKVEAAFARMTTPGGTRYVRPEDGRYIEFSFKPISDGGILAVFRDITELRQREEALAAAKADVERTRQVMQTAFDNMSDGVAVIDKDMRQQFMNRQRINSRQLPPELVQPGVHVREVMLFQARRGDYGPVNSEADVRALCRGVVCAPDDAGRHHAMSGARTAARSSSASSRSATAASSRCSATSPSCVSARRRWPRPRRTSSAPAS